MATLDVHFSLRPIAGPKLFFGASPERRTQMLRITMSVSPEAAAKYFDSALEKADYYAKSEASGKGIWGGKGAERLGLSGDVRREYFVSLGSNRNPGSDRNLTERTKERRRAGYDFTFSVPKSVSLYLAETGDR